MHLVSFWPLMLITRIHLWWAQVLSLDSFKKQISVSIPSRVQSQAFGLEFIVKGFLWLSFYSFSPWSNSFDLCRTLHALNVISSCILCILHFFICIIFFFILLLCFSFVWVKIQNHIKSEKFKKFDRICLSTYHMCVWPSTFI